MITYTFRRLLIGVVTLVLISFVIYGLIRAMPGDPASFQAMMMDPAGPTVTETQLAEMRRAFGLDRHWTVAYFEWAGRLLRGDLGTSLRRMAPVSGLILEAMGPTLLLSVTSLLLAYALSIPLGLYAAHRSGRPDERALTGFLYALYAFPSYVAAVFLLLVFAVKLGLLPVFGMRGPDHDELSLGGKVLDLARHMVLPVACYTYGALAYFTRFIRSNIAEVSRQDFIRAARAKGLREWEVLVKHAFRNSLIPFVTMIGLSFPALLSGSVILERIFAWPGMGRLFFDALQYRDYPVIMGLTMMFSVLVLLGTLVADLLYGVVDPRISYS